MNFLQAKKFCAPCAFLLAVLGGSTPNLAQTSPQARVLQSVRDDKRITLRGNVHPMARAENDRGTLPTTQPVTRMALLLQRSGAQETALQRLLTEQQDPKSPNYHAWLTPQQFGEQFGPAEADLQTIENWLGLQGFSNLKITNGRTLITFDGTAAQVRNAFHTDIHRLSVRGVEHFANMEEPQIPEALAPVVAGVHGLHNFHPQPLVKRLGKFQRNMNTGEITPLFTFTDVNGTFFGVGPADFRKIYNVPAGFDGSGVTIAVVGRTNINIQDVRDFRSIFGLPAKDPEIILNGPDPGIVSPDEEGEADLDTQWSGAIAPGADIKLVISETSQTDGTDGVDASAIYIVDNNLADVMSESFGSCEASLGQAGNTFFSALWQQAAAQGMSVMVSTGDNGSAGCDPPANNPNETVASQGLGVSGIASTAYNVAMGGTDFDQAGNQAAYWNTGNTSTTPPVPASAKGYIPEIPWNDSCASTGVNGCNSATANSANNPCPLCFVAGGGGSSSFTTIKPAWQSGLGDSRRDIPDVSLFSGDGQNSSFYIVCQSDQNIPGDTSCNLTDFSPASPFHDFVGVGGTSAAAPTFAGIMALVNQKTGQRQGNANFVLYALAKNETFSNCNSSSFTNLVSPPPASCVFLDVTKGNISVACSAGSPSCSKSGSAGNGVMTTNAGLAYPAVTGYDLATGLGSVNVANLLNAWTALTRPSASATLSTTTSFPITHGTPAHFAVNISPSAATGDVSLIGGANASQTQGIGPFTLSGGTVAISTNALPGGTYALKAHYEGDTTHGGADSNAITVTVNKESSKTKISLVTFDLNGTVTSTNASTAAYGSSYILRVDVTNSANSLCYALNGISQPVRTSGCPSGTVHLTDGGNALDGGSFTLNATGYFEDQPIQLNSGSHSIQATYAGDNSFTGSTSSATSVTITPATTTVAVSSSVTSVVSGGSVTLTATVNSQSNSTQGPTGTVQFKNGSTTLGTAVTCTPTGATSSAGALCTAQLTTALSALPPGFFLQPPPRNTPFVIVTLLAAMLATIGFLLAAKMPGRRWRYAYAGMVFAMIAAAALAGCSGSTGSGGGGGGGSARTISAAYSGDTNYAAASGSTTVTVK